MSDDPKNDPIADDPYKTSDKPPPSDQRSTGDYLPDAHPGMMIGHYKLLQPLGKGGMGEVWMAEQREPVHRYIAVKIVKTDLHGSQVIARFEAERQALAMMDHPNIAKVLDAGVIGTSKSAEPGASATGVGRPYFVMELVKGLSFTKYCDQEKLPLKDRLELFIPVCNAVQHAHQKGVVHRDLKPSNVLIALYDGKPVPKVIDFGVAKATHQKLTEKTMFTEVGQIVGTLEYMAPEQAELNNLDIDTRADIYSLGVMLYELLTGSPPFSSKELRSAAHLEMLRIIREVEPSKPSTKISSSEHLPSIAANRDLEPKSLARMVRGDLDWIVMKCLEKERTRRYDTANQLAEELRRFLCDEPVQAGPPSVGYRTRKFLRRNKGPVIAAGLVFTALVLGIIGTGLGFVAAEQAASEERKAKIAAQESEATEKRATQKALDAAEEEKKAKIAAQESEFQEKLATQKALDAAKREKAARDDAEKAAAKEQQANAIAINRLKQIEKSNALLESIFTDINPLLEKKGGPLLIEQLANRLADVAEKLDEKTIGDPIAVARMQVFLGITLANLGNAAKAIELDKKALATEAKLLGPNHPDTLTTMNNLASAYQDVGRLDLALPLFEEALKLRKAKLGPDHADTLHSMSSLALGYLAAGKLDLALPLLEDTLKRSKAKLGADHPSTLIDMSNMASAYAAAGKLQLALPLYEDTFKLFKATHGPDHHRTLKSMNNLAFGYRAVGRMDLALPLYEDGLMLLKAKLGPDHPSTLTCLNNLANAYRATGQPDLALPLFGDTLKRRKAKLGPNHPDTLRSMNDLAGAYEAAGKLDLALPLFEDTLKRRKAILGPDHTDTLNVMNNLAFAYQAVGKLDLALPLYEDALKRTKAMLGPDHSDTLNVMNNLAFGYQAVGKLDLALPLYEDALERIKAKLGPDHPRTLNIMTNLAVAYFANKEPKKAVPLFKEFVDVKRRQWGKDDPRLAGQLAVFALELLKNEQFDAAESMLRECLDIRAKTAPDAWNTFNTKSMLGGSLLGQKKYQDAAPLLKDGYEGIKAREKTIPPQGLPRLTEALERLVQLHEAIGNAAEAERYRKELAERKTALKEGKK